MKIFSLQSKTSLAAWSVGLGLLIGITTARFFIIHNCNPAGLSPGDCYYFERHGWPFSYYLSDVGIPLPKEIFLNLIFWVLAVLVVLSIIRYFKYDKR